jgi:hypothetical protein
LRQAKASKRALRGYDGRGGNNKLRGGLIAYNANFAKNFAILNQADLFSPLVNPLKGKGSQANVAHARAKGAKTTLKRANNMYRRYRRNKTVSALKIGGFNVLNV